MSAVHQQIPVRQPETAALPQEAAVPASHPIVVVGTGPVGIHFAQRLLDRDPLRPLLLFGDEPWDPYDRVSLTALLAGECSAEDLANPLRTVRTTRLVSRLNCAVVEIDRASARVKDAQGAWHAYHRLVLAVGSRPAVPDVPGVDLPGVFTLRGMSDAAHLMARRIRSRHTVVLGGGLLGLETARAMQRAGTRVTVLHRGPRLMNRQLDDGAGAILREHVETLAIRVELNTGLRAINGRHGVEAVVLGDGRVLECDTLVIAIGIRPNVNLARGAGLSVGQGIRVNDAMQTSDERIYAIGECAEHRGQVHGIVAPGIEQAGVAVDHVLGNAASYTGSIEATSLKVVGRQVFSIGRVGDEEDAAFDRAIVYRDPDSGAYRKLVTRGGRLVGALAVGEWPELGRVREAVTARRRILPWQLWRFRRLGRVWTESSARTVSQWPATATVCNCRAVTRGTLSDAVATGADTVEVLMRRTGASTVCGSCRPLLQELVQGAGAPAPAGRLSPSLLLLSLFALLLAPALALLPPLPYSDSVVAGPGLDLLWTNGLLKQITGFSLVGLSLLGMVMSLRKRTRLPLGGFPAWRLVHVAVGAGALILLILHTGMHLGSNLNLLLMLNFLALAGLGAVAGGVAALEQKLSPAWGGRLRRWWTWAHLLLFWPLPALLGFHILAVYYY